MFCRHIGIHHDRLIRGESPDLEKFSDLCGLPSEQLRFHAMARVGRSETTMLFGEAFSRRSLLNNALRFCPDCFSDDDAASDRMPGTRRYLRGIWMLPVVLTCAKHSRALVDATPPKRSRYLDFCNLLTALASDIEEKSMAAPKRAVSNLERFAHDRMNRKRTHGELLDGLSLDVVIDVSRLLGIALKHGKFRTITALTEAERIDAAEVGFDIIFQGRESIDRAIDEIASQNRRAYGVFPTYGKIHHVIINTRPGKEYDVPRRWITEHAARARSAGLQSTTIPAISRKLGVSVGTLRRRLKSAGYETKNGQPLSSENVALFRRFEGGAILQHEAADILGVSPKLILAFLKDGLLARLDLDAHAGAGETDGKTTKLVSRTEVEALRKTFMSQPSPSDPAKFVTIRNLALSPAYSHARLLIDVARGRFSAVARKEGRLLVDALALDPMELKAMRGLANLVNASEAGRLLGVVPLTVTKLMSHGIIPYVDDPARKGPPQRMISVEAIEKFRGRYKKISELAAAAGVDPRVLVNRMRRLDIEPAFPPELVATYFVKAEDLARLLAEG